MAKAKNRAPEQPSKGGLFELIKKHKAYAIISAVFAAIVAYGGISGGIRALFEDASLLAKPEVVPEAVYALDLVNVYGDIQTVAPGVPKYGGKTMLALGAIIANRGDPVSLTVGRDHSTFGPVITGEMKNQIPLEEPVQTIRPGPGLLVHVPIAYVPIEDAKADMNGRIDWIIKYGPSEQAMTREFPISGSISHNIVGGKNYFMWFPDGASAKPSGMAMGTTLKETP